MEVHAYDKAFISHVEGWVTSNKCNIIMGNQHITKKIETLPSQKPYIISKQNLKT